MDEGVSEMSWHNYMLNHAVDNENEPCLSFHTMPPFRIVNNVVHGATLLVTPSFCEDYHKRTHHEYEL